MIRSEWQASVHNDSGDDALGRRKKGDVPHQCLAHSGEAIGSGFRPFKSTNSVSCRSGSPLSLAVYSRPLRANTSRPPMSQSAHSAPRISTGSLPLSTENASLYLKTEIERVISRFNPASSREALTLSSG